MSEMIRSIIDQPWRPFGLSIALVLTSVGQWIFRTLAIHEFRHAAYMTNMVASLVMLPVFGLPLMWCKIKCGGFLPEMQSRVIRRSFVSIGFCNAIAQIMQTFSFFDTPVSLQASLGHLIIPFAVAFVITGRPSLYRKFSLYALIGATIIVSGSFGHISVAYLSSPASNDADQIFWNAIFLLSSIPLAISSLSQQHTYSIRRLNVFHFLFHTTLFQLLFEVGLLPLNCIKGIDSFQWSHLLSSIWNFFTCLLGLEDSTGICPSHTWTPRYFLFGYISFTIAAQLLQILASFETCSYAILSIPTLTFILFMTLTTAPTSSILRALLGPTARDRLFISQGSSSFPFTLTILHIAILSGSIIYRLDKGNDLKKDFVLPADALFHDHRDIFQLFAPFLQSDPSGTAYRRALPRPSSSVNNQQSRLTTPAQESVASPQQCDDYNELIPPFSIRIGATPTHFLSPRAQSPNHAITNHTSNSPIALPFYLPSPMPQHRPLPSMVRPVLMNPWSGCILCEYTDYKRLNDCVAPPGWRSSSQASIVSEDASAYEPNPLQCHVWEQYTLRHLDTLSCTEQALKKLYEYQSIGTLAASIVAAQEAEEEQSRPGSESSLTRTRRGAEEDSDASSLGERD